MSDDKVGWVCFTVMVLGVLGAAGHGCASAARSGVDKNTADRAAQTGAQEARAKAPTVVTCTEHSVLDRVQVVQ